MKYCPRCATPLVRAVRGERERATCPDDSCGFVHWDNPTPVVAAVVEDATSGEVILVRNHGWPEKMFGLVTGFLERDESPEDGVLREVSEELGLDGELRARIGVYPFFEQNQLILAYHVTATGEVTLGDELADHRRIPRERLRPWPFGTGHAVADWLAGKTR